MDMASIEAVGMAHPHRPWPWARRACLLSGGLLLADSLTLMAMGLFMLGVTLPFALGLALALLVWRWHAVQRRLERSAALRRGWRAGWLLLGAWVASVLVVWAAIARTAWAPAKGTAGAPPQAILVLGSATPQGRPAPPLQARLDTAIALATRHPSAWLVVSGGVDFGETLSEGQVMGDYLRAHGVAPQRILQEERSTSTELNLKLSLPLLQSRGLGLETPLAVVTSDFHTVRAQRIARKIGYTQAWAVAAPTPPYIRFNAWLREYFAMASSWMLGEL
ncbi:YdcF family protein [Paracidovorax anthurii]|uniref:Uncharacterized SAM-binding protein YcdF (DUF218 family) n=1 Tax=Paracidovorax anthurii TaxID=78229 RepID=A0A328YXW9_9BURK|nr:YdcF family protein [Paracidovorax anthurii]RAR78861.1 uncharacterized SAM-binding protein YcdF (DUF218 family) [Paracidovorax anthurii]